MNFCTFGIVLFSNFRALWHAESTYVWTATYLRILQNNKCYSVVRIAKNNPKYYIYEKKFFKRILVSKADRLFVFFTGIPIFEKNDLCQIWNDVWYTKNKANHIIDPSKKMRTIWKFLNLELLVILGNVFQYVSRKSEPILVLGTILCQNSKMLKQKKWREVLTDSFLIWLIRVSSISCLNNTFWHPNHFFSSIVKPL